MNPLFNVTEDDLKYLNPIGLADFANRLLRAEGSRIGLPPTSIHTTLRVNIRDAGVDARVSDNDRLSDWIPLGTSVWQFKSGEDHSPATLRDEFHKTDVLDVLKAGGSYRVVVSDDLGNIERKNRVKALEDCCRAEGIPTDLVKLLAADKVAVWAREHPAMRLLLAGPTLGGLYRWADWAAQTRFSQEYKADEQRSEVIAAFRHSLADSRGSVLMGVEGLAGIGKSRLGLEVLRPQTKEDGLPERVLYAEDPDAIPAELWAWIAATPKAELILVVDECDRDQGERLERQALRSNGRVRVITIGRAREARLSDRARPNFFLLDRLNDTAMRSLLTTVVPGLPDPAYDFTVRVASGYVKIAVKIAEAVDKHPERVSLREMLSDDYNVRAVVRDFLVTDEGDLRAMRALALMSRVGWDDEFQSEGQAVVSLVGLEWHEARSRVKRLTDEGIVAKQGRYRYVTPHLLAVWLASEVWEIYGDETLHVLNNLPSASSGRAFLERLRDLGDAPHARRVCEGLLAPDGQFRDLMALDDEWRSQVFALLAQAHPQAGIRALQRLLDGLPRGDLMGLRNGRRQIVSLLQKLAWFPDTFADAARLLLTLAGAENEHWANNANGAWVDLFGTHLGATAARPLQRYELIAEALDGPSLEHQLLGVKAISRIFVLQETTFVFGDAQGGRVPPERWSPQTWEEDRDVRLAGLRLLDRALSAKDPRVRAEAQDVLLEQATELATVGLVNELADRLECLPLPDYDRRRKVRDAAEGVLMFEELHLSSEQRERLTALCKRLAGSSFGDRLRRWVGEHIMADWHLERQDLNDSSGHEAATLAEEAMGSPDLLWPELEWLASDQARHVYFFARRLGQLDAEHGCWAEIEALVREGKGFTLAGAYLQGHIDEGRRHWRDIVLDDWSEEAALAPAVLDAVFRSEPPSDGDAELLFRLMDHGWLTASQVSVLSWGGQTSPFKIEGFVRIILGVLQEDREGTTASALGLLSSRLRLCPMDKDTLEPYVWQVLERPDALEGRQYHASDLAQSYMERDPVRAARLVLRHIERGGGSLLRGNGTIRLLEQATRLRPKEVWLEVSRILWPLRQESYAFYLGLKGWYGQVVGAEVLLAWAEQHPEDGPWQAASLVHVSGQTLDPLAREFLIRYKDDERVGNALSAEFGSGSWTGPTSGWYRFHVDAARQWMNDPHPAVRMWAAREVEIYEKRLADALLQEEEGR